MTRDDLMDFIPYVIMAAGVTIALLELARIMQ